MLKPLLTTIISRKAILLLKSDALIARRAAIPRPGYVIVVTLGIFVAYIRQPRKLCRNAGNAKPANGNQRQIVQAASTCKRRLLNNALFEEILDDDLQREANKARGFKHTMMTLSHR